MTTPFDILTHPLRAGTRSLIEASAGTGKTTALENLTLRLLIDGIALPDGSSRPVRLAEILLVTFTEAAAAELIRRVRENLLHALEILKNGSKIDSAAVTGKILLNSRTPRNEIALRLRLALLSFDENSIFTIHGFCQKILNHYTFESNRRFNLRLITDDRPFLDEVVNDYWRERFYVLEDELEQKIVKVSKWEPGILRDLLRRIQRAPLAEIPAPVIHHELHEVYAEFREYCHANRKLLYRLNDRRENFVDSKPGKVDKGFKQQLADALNAFISFEDVFYLIRVFSQAEPAVRKSPKPDWSGFADPVPAAGKLPKDFAGFLELAQKLDAAIAAYLAGLKFDFIDHVRNRGVLKRKKLEEGVLSFDDLLLDTYEALHSSERFRDLVRRDFPVLMLDEFQDTDTLQFRIFDRLFRNDESLMVMVGDPKQSIYQFRGADIFSYLQVSEQLAAGEKCTLNVNYRSDERLLAGLNTVFDLENPFIEASIRYSAAISAGGSRRRLVIADGSENDRRLKIMTGGEKLAKDAAGKFFNRAVSNKIVSILLLARQTDEYGRPLARFENEDGRWEPVRARDIAVLTARNEDAQAVYEQLANAGVQAALRQSGNIFKSNEATELLLLFNAIIQPGDPARVKSALAASLFGLQVSALEALGNATGKADIETWQESFLALLEVWREKGFIHMFFRLLESAQTKVKARLLSLPQGERRLTNLLQLMELLHQQAVLKQLSPTALIYWLHRQITDSEDKEEHELRLESDDSAVKIMTVHKSKGLQFPIVFCTNLWQNTFISSRTKNKEKDFFYHRPDENGRYTQYFELDSPEADIEPSRLLYRREVLGELIRLAYVALTRAENYCCFTVWDNVERIAASAVGYLAERPTPAELEELLKSGKSAGTQRGRQAWNEDADIEMIAVSDADTGEMLKLTGSVAAPVWKTIPPLRAMPQDWGIMSFSALTADRRHDSDFRPGDDDEDFSCVPPVSDREPDLFSGTLPLGDFPSGPAAGNCIHAIFAQFDLAAVKSPDWRQNPQLERMIKDQLFLAGLIEGGSETAQFARSESRRYDQICAMLENVLTCPLPGRDGTFFLADLETGCRQPEMEFFFPAGQVPDIGAVNALLRHLGGGEIAALTAGRGFVNGFIDLVFATGNRYYIIDWKSNNLGSHPDDYAESALALNMRENHYQLQAAIYLLALHKYLEHRLPDYDFNRHLGGVFYLYVRGMKNDFPDTGIYRIEPDRKTLELAENLFGAEL
ncbi:MAG: exodeoxyribonuclease V subunit beta [Victivallaceae bacterium]|nr:exodeoxyribonuclease V subunit beta [Victivallaceae bacterium]